MSDVQVVALALILLGILLTGCWAFLYFKVINLKMDVDELVEWAQAMSRERELQDRAQ